MCLRIRTASTARTSGSTRPEETTTSVPYVDGSTRKRLGMRTLNFVAGMSFGGCFVFGVYEGLIVLCCVSIFTGVMWGVHAMLGDNGDRR